MARKRTKKPPSIRIKLEGHRTLAELRDMLIQAIAELEERPFELYNNCNLYVTPVVPDGGKHLDTIEINAPYSCAADEHGA